jgi:predicted transcriptional regulator
MVKFAAGRAGEIGRNVTEQDIIDRMSVKDAVEKSSVMIPVNMPLRQVFDMYANSSAVLMPVLDNEKKLVGAITMDQLKDTLFDQSSWDWLLAADVMADWIDPVEETTLLRDALSLMNQLQVDQIPVVKNGVLSGILDRKTTTRKVHMQMLGTPGGAVPVVSG